MTTASPFDAALRDVIERLSVATSGLAGDLDQSAVADQAVALGLELTRSSEAVLGLGGSSAEELLYSRSAETARALTHDSVDELLAAAGHRRVVAHARAGGTSAGRRGAAISAELKVGEQLTGVLVVGRAHDYDENEKRLLAIFAAYVSRALESAALRQRQHSLETALAEVRPMPGQQDPQLSVLDAEIGIVERVERANDLGVEVLVAVSAHATSGESLTTFFHELSKTIAGLVDAEKVLFWRLKDQTTLVPDGGYGLTRSFEARLAPTRCEPAGDDIASRVVFQDLVFRAARQDGPSESGDLLETLGVASAISVPWRAGNARLGMLAAYNSWRRGGFLREDAWVLQKAGLAAGLVTQLWHAQEDLRKSVDRLTKVDAARQLLLKNMTTVVEKERQRFVAELHDDALQKLTAAEMHAARLEPGGLVDSEAHEALTRLLADTETALRRLVFEVHPPSLESPDGLTRSINDRLAMLNASGIRSELEFALPETMSHEMKALIFRQVAEAIGNVERHSKASEVKISLSVLDGGVMGTISDNGVGFAVAEKSNLPGHLGLQALKERSLMSGGRYKIESQPGVGSRIEFWIPLD